MKKGLLFLSSVCLSCLATSVLAAPSLPVTKPWVVDTNILSGPAIDPAAIKGQWFLDYASGAETNRTHEFYDNISGDSMGANAITGYVSSITFMAGPGTPILAFSIQATVWNDTTLLVTYLDGTNSHGETLSYKELPYVGDMLDVKLTASFAITGTNNLPLLWAWRPYRDRQPYIEATNEDQAAWYCWSPDDPDPLHQPKGNYFVPTWDFGTIPQGQSATRQLDFIVQGGGILPGGGDPRYTVIFQSFVQQSDVLLNRTTSLKISTWIDEISADNGIPYPEEEPYSGSDVSVFHNIPEEEELLDFGDAPDTPYPTLLANDGARHIIVPGVQMGLAVDWETDGQPTAAADGDDTNMVFGVDDEDGVAFMGANFSGQTNTLAVGCSTSGWLYIWVDFDANGSWGDFGESQSSWATQGVNYVQIFFPTNSAIGNTYARFRFTTETNYSLNYTGQARDGEVEDYRIIVQNEEEEQLDFGDAMDPTYPTLWASMGACHTIVPGICLGTNIDAEADGQPTLNADGDDNNPPPPMGIDDEDGVTLPPEFVAGASPQSLLWHPPMASLTHGLTGTVMETGPTRGNRCSRAPRSARDSMSCWCPSLSRRHSLPAGRIPAGGSPPMRRLRFHTPAGLTTAKWRIMKFVSKSTTSATRPIRITRRCSSITARAIACPHHTGLAPMRRISIRTACRPFRPTETISPAMTMKMESPCPFSSSEVRPPPFSSRRPPMASSMHGWTSIRTATGPMPANRYPPMP